MRDRVLFGCVRNAGRSQMAAAFARQISAGNLEVYSAGSAPGDEIHPHVVTVMREVGLDLSNEYPTLLIDETV